MSAGTSGLARTIGSATDLQSVVRTMKSLAASSVGQYEKAVLALADYHRSVELGLGACFRAALEAGGPPDAADRADAGPVAAIVFGSDQGLVGQFNDAVADHAIRTLAALPDRAPTPDREPARPLAQYWAVGERVHARLADSGQEVLGLFGVPASVDAIAGLVAQIQVASETHRARFGYSRVYLFHNRPRPGAVFEPVGQRLLPLDAAWQRSLADLRWPGGRFAQVLPHAGDTLRGFVREYLFISLYRACAESLASENASRLAAMERADKNIIDMLHELNRTFHRMRQNAIDDELFDVTAGFNALA